MKNPLPVLVAACSLISPQLLSAETVVIDEPEMAGISGFRAFWDLPVVVKEEGMVEPVSKPQGTAPSAFWSPEKREGGTLAGAPVFDAVHRSLLVKFPTAARKLGQLVNEGKRIEKLELILPFAAVELWPEGYAEPSGMSFLGKQWDANPPRWHAVAWPLRRAWTTDAETGPTFNAAINGLEYWTRFGAADEETDRFPLKLGPTEVNEANPEGRMDLSAFLTDSTLGETLPDRLRVLAHQGLLLKKWEVYDVALWKGGYEWTTGTGPRGIIVKAPRLEATLANAAGKREKVDLAAVEWDAASTIAKLKSNGKSGEPTAVMPDEAVFKALLEEYAVAQPDWMPGWQWERVQELSKLGGEGDFPQDHESYKKWIDAMLSLAPRRWDGFQGPKYAQWFFQYNKALPDPVKDHWKLYWWAWLMPDRANEDLVQGYIGGDLAQAYYKETGDWRGNFSVYRTYVRAMGTVNFNSWATAGTLLGGAILEDDFLIKEGRNGLDQWMLRTWSWLDGSHQESIDHYYLAHTLQANKAYTDFGPEEMDCMMGSMIQTKNIGELVGAYHPNLRRFISPSSRTGIAYLLGIQDGLQYILHTLSRKGTLTDVGKETTAGGMRPIAKELSPALVAEQTAISPWAPEWMAEMVDNKPLPFAYTNSYTQWGGFKETPLWRKGFLGHYYGLASQDVNGNETVPVMAQWVRKPEAANTAGDLGTLLVRYGFNTTEFLDSIFHDTEQRNPNGIVGVQGGTTSAIQHNNKVMVLTSPLDQLKFEAGRPVPEEITSLQTSIALMNFEEPPSWEIYVGSGKDFRRVKTDELPLKVGFKDRIVIRDGVSFIGVVPVPGTDLGRDAEVIITDEGELTALQGSGEAKPALTINAYNFRSSTPLDMANADWKKIRNTFGGFVIEVADVVDYPRFEDFLAHIGQAVLKTEWDADSNTVAVDYKRGEDNFDVVFKPDHQSGVRTDEVFPRRLVNGEWPYLGIKMDRDSTYSQQGRTGRLEKNGSVLIAEEDRMAYLETVPALGITAAYNPFPEPMTMEIQTPEGAKITGNGKLGLTRIVFDAKANSLTVDYPAQNPEGEGMADQLTIQGVNEKPTVTLNGETLQPGGDSGSGWAVALRNK
jgi:hypothetical protein